MCVTLKNLKLKILKIELKIEIINNKPTKNNLNSNECVSQLQLARNSKITIQGKNPKIETPTEQIKIKM